LSCVSIVLVQTFMAAAGVTVGSYKPNKSEPGPPMTLANMRNNHVRRLIVYCLSPYCHHSAVMEVDGYDGAVPVKSFQRRMVCTRCGAIGADVRAELDRSAAQAAAALTPVDPKAKFTERSSEIDTPIYRPRCMPLPDPVNG
jgi:hypothetical protein